MRFLLDTNILSELERNPRGRAAHRVREVGPNNVCTSIIVAAEIRYGVAKKGSPNLKRNLELILGSMEVLPFAFPADKIYGDLRFSLEQAGKLIGPHDLLIASQTLAFGYTLVTDNVREFSRIRSLSIENWVR